MMRTAAHRSVHTGLIAGLTVLVLCLGLAVWQWQRADETRAWLTAQQHKAASAPLSLTQVLAMDDYRFQPVRLRGSIDNAHPILVNSRTYHGQVGYYLLSPLHTDQGRWVLINRGWLPAGEYRSQLPAIPTISKPVTVIGNAYQPEHNPFLASDNSKAKVESWPWRIGEVNIKHIEAQLGVQLAPFEVRLRSGQQLDGLAPLPKAWKAVEATISPARHIGYSVQWLAIGVAGLVVFTLAGRRRERHRRPHKRDD